MRIKGDVLRKLPPRASDSASAVSIATLSSAAHSAPICPN